jgi:hypothetical protein
MTGKTTNFGECFQYGEMRFRIMAAIVFQDGHRAKCAADALEAAGYSVEIRTTVVDVDDPDPAVFAEADHFIAAANEQAAIDWAFAETQRIVDPFGGIVDEAGLRQLGEKPFAMYEEYLRRF